MRVRAEDEITPAPEKVTVIGHRLDNLLERASFEKRR
jgi:hypothetical protein